MPAKFACAFAGSAAAPAPASGGSALVGAAPPTAMAPSSKTSSRPDVAGAAPQTDAPASIVAAYESNDASETTRSGTGPAGAFAAKPTVFKPMKAADTTNSESKDEESKASEIGPQPGTAAAGDGAMGETGQLPPASSSFQAVAPAIGFKPRPGS